MLTPQYIHLGITSFPEGTIPTVFNNDGLWQRPIIDVTTHNHILDHLRNQQIHHKPRVRCCRLPGRHGERVCRHIQTGRSKIRHSSRTVTVEVPRWELPVPDLSGPHAKRVDICNEYQLQLVIRVGSKHSHAGILHVQIWSTIKWSWNNRAYIALQQYMRLAPDSKLHGANMGPSWGGQDSGGPHVGHMNFVIWGIWARGVRILVIWINYENCQLPF